MTSAASLKWTCEFKIFVNYLLNKLVILKVTFVKLVLVFILLHAHLV